MMKEVEFKLKIVDKERQDLNKIKLKELEAF